MSIIPENKVKAVAVNGNLRENDCSYHTWIVEVEGQLQALNTPNSLIYEGELEDLAAQKSITLLDTPQHVEADTIAWHLGHQWKKDISTLGSITIELPSTKTAVGELFVSTVHKANARRKTMTEVLLKCLDQAASALLHSEDREELIPATQALVMLCSSRNQELMWELGPRLSALYLLAGKPEHAHNVWRYRFKKHIDEHDYEERVRRVREMWSFQRQAPVKLEPFNFDLFNAIALNHLQNLPQPSPSHFAWTASSVMASVQLKQPRSTKHAHLRDLATMFIKTQLGEKP